MSACVVAVVAHPDDESLIAGGTLALAARAGATAAAVSLTRGELGPISDPALATTETLGEVRAGELCAAGEALGLAWTACLGHPDGELPWVDHELASGQVAELLAAFDPIAVLTFGDEGLYGHPDHVASRQIAGLAAGRMEARGASCELYEAAWPTGLVAELAAAAQERGLPTGLWGLEPAAFGSEEPATLTVDVGSVLASKLAALRAHRTQLDPDHLLGSLPHDLAERFLGEESWRRVAADGDGLLASLLGEHAHPWAGRADG